MLLDRAHVEAQGVKGCVAKFGCYDMGDIHKSTKGVVKVFEKVLGNRVKLKCNRISAPSFPLDW